MLMGKGPDCHLPHSCELLRPVSRVGQAGRSLKIFVHQTSNLDTAGGFLVLENNLFSVARDTSPLIVCNSLGQDT